MSSQEPVCGNRFVKIFYAPEAARQKVEKEKIANMLKVCTIHNPPSSLPTAQTLQERREKLAEAQMKEAKRNEATARVAAAKAAVTTAKDAITTLKARLQEAPHDAQLAEEMLRARAFLKEAFEEHFASLAAWKAVTAKAASPAAPAWQKKGVGFGAHTFDARTTYAASRTFSLWPTLFVLHCRVFKLRSLPVEWQKSPSKMRRAMDKFGEVLGCAVGKKPLQGFVKFSKRFEAERAVRALEEQQHKPEWVDKFKLEGEWPKVCMAPTHRASPTSTPHTGPRNSDRAARSACRGEARRVQRTGRRGQGRRRGSCGGRAWVCTATRHARSTPFATQTS